MVVVGVDKMNLLNCFISSDDQIYRETDSHVRNIMETRLLCFFLNKKHRYLSEYIFPVHKKSPLYKQRR